MSHTLVVIDLDGTIVDAKKRFQLAGPEPDRRADVEAYDKWLGRVQSTALLSQDSPIKGMHALLWALQQSPCTCLYLTARGEEFREVTGNWLTEHGFPALELIMRQDDNKLSSVDFKEKMIKLAKWNTRATNVVVIDDLPEIIDMVLVNGWTPLQAFGGYSK